MPKTRCLGCGRLCDSRGSRCSTCQRARKRRRNSEARALGKCPQVGVICNRCGGAPREGDPMVWDHVGTPFGMGGQTVSPAHRTCNSRARDRH